MLNGWANFKYIKLIEILKIQCRLSLKGAKTVLKMSHLIDTFINITINNEIHIYY